MPDPRMDAALDAIAVLKLERDQLRLERDQLKSAVWIAVEAALSQVDGSDA